MKTNNVIDVPRQPFKTDRDRYSTEATFYFKEGGVKYYIDEISDSIIHIRNSKTGESRIEMVSQMNEGRHSSKFYFEFN